MKRVLGAELIALRTRVDHWREHRVSERSRIPQELWDAAVQVAHTEGVHATAKALRFNYDALKKRLKQSGAKQRSCGSELAAVAGAVVDEPSKAAFVQVEIPPSGAERGGSRMVIELTGPCGDRMRIDATDAARVDVVGMVQAFWSRAS